MTAPAATHTVVMHDSYGPMHLDPRTWEPWTADGAADYRRHELARAERGRHCKISDCNCSTTDRRI